MSNQRGDLPWTPAEDAALLTFVPKFRTQLELPASVVARQLGMRFPSARVYTKSSVLARLRRIQRRIREGED